VAREFSRENGSTDDRGRRKRTRQNPAVVSGAVGIHRVAPGGASATTTGARIASPLADR